MTRRGGEESVKRDFETLVAPNEDALFAGALRFTGNRADAEDLLQETYMRAFIGFKRSQDIGKPRAWLFKIMTNAYINRYHKRRREPTRVSYEEGLDHLIADVYAPSADDPKERFFSRLFDGEVEEALNALPEQFREAVILCDVSGLTYEEISDVLDCPLGTVRSRISRGREMLFNRLYDYAREHNLIRKGEKGRQEKEWTAGKPGK